MRGKILTIPFLVFLLTALSFQSALAGTAVWKAAVDSSYDLSFPGTILVYKDELSQGGLSIAENKITTDKNSADVVFGTRPDIAARGVKDLGNVNFDSVSEIPSDGYSTDIKANAGHVYIVLTHDDNFAKIQIKSIIGQKVLLKYALLDRIADNAQNSPIQNTGATGSATPSAPATPASPSESPEPTTQTNPLANPTVNNSTVNNNTLTATDGSLNIMVNGKPLRMDVKPFVNDDGRTMVPLRVISEALGATVQWDEATQTVTFTKDGRSVSLVIGSNTASIDGQTVALDTRPVVKDNRTMVPARFISESLGAKVGWDDKTQTVNIDKADGTTTQNKDNAANNTANNDLADFFHLYKLIVTGAVVEVPVGLDATVFKATPGAMAGGIAIYADGTYVWNSTWDGKVIEGNWVRSQDSSYPITIVNGESGKDWKLGKAGPHVWGDIVLWDGYIWKNGKMVN